MTFFFEVEAEDMKGNVDLVDSSLVVNAGEAYVETALAVCPVMDLASMELLKVMRYYVWEGLLPWSESSYAPPHERKLVVYNCVALQASTTNGSSFQIIWF